MSKSQRAALAGMMDAILACDCADEVMRARANALKFKLDVSRWLVDLYGLYGGR